MRRQRVLLRKYVRVVPKRSNEYLRRNFYLAVQMPSRHVHERTSMRCVRSREVEHLDRPNSRIHVQILCRGQKIDR
jgi:hypothetical protein